MTIFAQVITYLVCIAITGIIAALFYIANRDRFRKRPMLDDVANELGMTCTNKPDWNLPRAYGDLTEIAIGGGHASRVVRGQIQGQEVVAFTYLYKTGMSNAEYICSIYTCDVGTPCPKVRIIAESFWSRLVQAPAGDDIELDSVEFSGQFLVQSPDRSFAYAFCSTSMMDYLLTTPDICVEITGSTLATVYPGALDSKKLAQNIERLLTIRDLIPAHLLR